jgi:hypothetical protein
LYTKVNLTFSAKSENDGGIRISGSFQVPIKPILMTMTNERIGIPDRGKPSDRSMKKITGKVQLQESAPVPTEPPDTSKPRRSPYTNYQIGTKSKIKLGNISSPDNIIGLLKNSTART